MFSLLETRVKALDVARVCNSFGPSWSYLTNYASHPGGRIRVMWNPEVFVVDIQYQSPQMIHCYVTHKGLNKSFYCSFVYGFNGDKMRDKLWEDLITISGSIKGPWFVGGDFNNPLNFEDRLGSKIRWNDIVKFRNCIEVCELMDMKNSGAFYTWTNKQEGGDHVHSKIDRSLVNLDWASSFPGAETWFLLEGLFDHCPTIIRFLQHNSHEKKTF